ncbi:MAG: HAD hydrolase-like protein [Pseudomonadota bacterium]
MSYGDTLRTDQAFERYEQIRARMPEARFGNDTQACSGLLEIADQYDAFLLDSFGVLNVGERAVPGAIACIAELRRRGKLIAVLTNAASYTQITATERYARLGFDFAAHEVISSRDVAARRLSEVLPNALWGAIAAPGDGFEDISARVVHWTGQPVDGILMLSSVSIDGAMLAALRDELARAPKPLVVGNPDLVAPREAGLSKEPGFYAHALADDLAITPIFFGKPFADAFDDGLGVLAGIPADRIAMVGDTLHTDILGGAQAGMGTVLVRDHGLFAGLDTAPFIARSGIVPDFSCAAI